VCLVSYEAAKLSCEAAAWVCVPCSHDWALATPRPRQHLVLSVSWILAVLVGVQWNLVIICISLMTRGVEHLLMHLSAVSMSSLVRCLLRKVFGPFFNQVVRSLIVEF